MGCGADPIDFSLVDAYGNRVNTWDPCRILPACPGGWGTLPQGSEHQLTFRFNGVVFPEIVTACPSMVSAAPSGRYTLKARFTYGFSPHAMGMPLIQEREISFDWASSPVPR